VKLSKEFETDLSVTGQTKALRRITARGFARFRISNPNIFLEQIASRSNFENGPTLDALNKYCQDLLKKEMSSHEFQELKDNPSILQGALTSGVRSVGLEPIKIAFSWVSEMGPGMFGGPGGMPPMMDPEKIAQLRQMAEAMRATQYSMPRAQANVICSFCNSPNPPTGKFCNSCGKPLLAQPTNKVCPKCGQESQTGIKFCGNCGTKLP
jgi:membrane protease subunit (stomatin/prohibitin family)